MVALQGRSTSGTSRVSQGPNGVCHLVSVYNRDTASHSLMCNRSAKLKCVDWLATHEHRWWSEPDFEVLPSLKEKKKKKDNTLVCFQASFQASYCSDSKIFNAASYCCNREKKIFSLAIQKARAIWPSD